uniref:ribosomal protein S20 n=1 Tax=Chlorobotrys sp. TaxID=2859677 RepID=UPI002181F647|nr:ribosomal protein S20 [Chlorobotrys sp.]UVI60861.1 ribosomal protein S20 [Chlorobotrys sp.]
MANIKSAKKKVRIGQRNLKLNRFYKSTVKTLLKRYRLAIKIFEANKDAKTYEVLKSLVSKIYSRIDKATNKNVFHRRKAARQKSRISKLLKKIS